MAQDKAQTERMDKIVSLCKARGIIFQSSEIYGGLNGCWDYGPLGAELKRNLKDFWWRRMVRERDDVVGMDGSILMNRAIWQASGHEATFCDPMVDCLLTKKRFRADQVEKQSGTVIWFAGAESVSTGWKVERRFGVLLKKNEDINRARKLARQYYAVPETAADVTYLEEKSETVEDSICFNPENGSLLTEPRPFNLMFKTYVGATEDESAVTYLRPETAQAIFVQFKNILDTSRKKLPFGIAQIGKAFRNEINPRNFTFRSREFEQMELEYFCKPDQGAELLEYWLQERLRFYEDIGLSRDKLHVLKIKPEDLAFYSKGTYDIEYEFPFGIQELEGVAYRTDYDLTQHQTGSGKSLVYFDEETKEKYIPHVVEPSAGVDRTVLALICSAYDEETIVDENGKTDTRTVLRFHPRIAPIKCGIFPLLKNNEGLVAKAKEITAMLRPHFMVFYDQTGAVGRRYRRQDEGGTPFCVTVDFETMGERGDEFKDTVTIRDRDTMKQHRIHISELREYISSRIL